ncbi:Co/Zn/Cd cation transporter-like protein [Halteromyces radiatus]|uniref:Co/Zn/Cd cation transporter-like protein n=1 Tax=Halteromyces radiatus TaxID=101107 RepID=UPI0022206D6A|nr:Co/Zn/Cd cation transporter-like protein [Halteromyces radiatus]KAI8093745.1 Co/Zn/Cd cation transporter-like protein [Halteromyces radiatus]
MNTKHYEYIAIVVCSLTILYCVAEGIISVTFGSESDSSSLLFLGIDSLVEVVSASLVLWRMASTNVTSKRDKFATLGIGIMFLLLTIGTIVVSCMNLSKMAHPESTLPGIIISSVSIVVMAILWLTKRWLAKRLNSSTLESEAKCSFACLRITCVLFVGSMIFYFWKGGWWVDSAAALVLALFFGWESYEMISWALSKKFDGGCSCSKK